MHVIFSLSSGGAEKVVVNLCNEQVNNHEVILLTILEGSKKNSFYVPILDKRIKHVSLNSKSGFSIVNFFKFIYFVNRISPEVIHYHLNSVVYGFFLTFFNKKIKSIHTLHSLAQHSIGFKGQKLLNKWFYKTNRIVPVALSKECSDSISDIYGLKKTDIVLNGVPEFKKSNDFDNCLNFFQNLKSKGDEIVYIHVARYDVEIKNQKLLFSVFNELISENNLVHLIIIGRDYPILNYTNFHFLGEISNPVDFVVNSDAFVLSSIYEGIPMSVLEALSCGIPILTTPAGGLIDILKNDELGVISEDFSFEKFKEALYKMNNKLINNKFESEKIKNTYRNLYSVDKCSEKYLKIYKS
jgi:glycosyltransferase involved in cell wall biosynthesis